MDAAADLTGEDPDAAALIAARPHLTRHAMDGLVMEDVPLAAIADALGTPTWVLSAGALRRRYRALAAALAHAGQDGAALDAHIHYAVKANDHLAVLRLLGAEGAGADVVSAGELLRARQGGIAPGAIVFSGVGKTGDELRLALAQGIAQINVESAEELDLLSVLATEMGRTAPVVLRVNPDIDAGTHAKITTGRAGDKFGIAHDDIAALYARGAALPGIAMRGLAVHIGSQVRAMGPYRAAFDRIASLVRDLRGAGQSVDVADCGGGLAVGYRGEPDGSPAALAGAIRASLGGMGLRLMIEPGRWLVAGAGVLLAGVVREKASGGHRIVVLDAGMNDLARPALYDAWHGIVPLDARESVLPGTPADVVGPVCESADTFARSRMLPPLGPHARVAILDAGAYGAAMSSTYNARPLAAQAMVDGARWSVIRPRQDVADLWAAERVPDWLSSAG
jgi:diaminopimelate decarboxylase